MLESFPNPSAYQSRGIDQDFDYSWDKEQHVPQLLRDMAPGGAPGVLIGQVNGKFALMVCNLIPPPTLAWKDFMGRFIRHSLLWDSLDENQARKLALSIMQKWSEFAEIVKETLVPNASIPERGWRVEIEKLEKWLSGLPEIELGTQPASTHRIWRRYGEPGTPDWTAATEWLADHKLASESLSFVISKDPNPKHSERLKREAHSLLTLRGPENWEEIPEISETADRGGTGESNYKKVIERVTSVAKNMNKKLFTSPSTNPEQLTKPETPQEIVIPTQGDEFPDDTEPTTTPPIIKTPSNTVKETVTGKSRFENCVILLLPLLTLPITLFIFCLLCLFIAFQWHSTSYTKRLHEQAKGEHQATIKLMQDEWQITLEQALLDLDKAWQTQLDQALAIKDKEWAEKSAKTEEAMKNLKAKLHELEAKKASPAQTPN